MHVGVVAGGVEGVAGGQVVFLFVEVGRRDVIYLLKQFGS